MSEPTAATVPASSESIVAGQAPGIRRRYLKDRLARGVVWTGGLSVILALMLIFFYLLAEVAPLFGAADLERRQHFAIPGAAESPTVFVAAEEQAEVGMRVGGDGAVNFFDLHDGRPLQQQRLPIGEARIVRIADVNADQGLLAAGLSDGGVLLFRHRYRVTYPDDQRLITPQLEYPNGEVPISLGLTAARALAVRDERGTLLMAALGDDGQIALKRIEKTESFLGDVEITEGPLALFSPAVEASLLLMEPLQGWLYAIDGERGRVAFYRLDGDRTPELIGEVVEVGSPVTAASYLAGGISIVLAQQDGKVSQWFPARRDNGDSYLARVRDFQLKGDAQATAIGPEIRRRTFAVGDAQGRVTLFYATSGGRVASEQMLQGPVSLLAFNPRANYLMAVGEDGQAVGYDVHNEHPEVSLGALWGRVWYESYDEPRFLWQSSSASSDFEPKFSLTPLAFGTLKAAFYAMLFAVPLAILGAIYTANFMSTQMRQVVKPTVELLQALPTVILGFLAGLWLAPFVESELLGVVLTLFLLPLSVPLFGYLWLRAPRGLRLRVPPGWEAALLVPVILGMTWLCFTLSKPLEIWFFAGNLQSWMDRELGIGYDQRNALIVGIAMGVAVIPVIYSIAEDAIFSVPRHLSLGSLALGATPWQTLIGVVLPTASPGIFSAVMIGMGRAVGETMVVLMATGNTAVMDPSLFQGLRTFSANIAVEMPESEVGSTHFRLLFMAGLVLFVFTFFFNTLAEVVRQRLRQKYSAI